MTTFVEDFSTWGVEALIRVPPESLEAADLMALVIELQNRLFKEFAAYGSAKQASTDH